MVDTCICDAALTKVDHDWLKWNVGVDQCGVGTRQLRRTICVGRGTSERRQNHAALHEICYISGVSLLEMTIKRLTFYSPLQGPFPASHFYSRSTSPLACVTWLLGRYPKIRSYQLCRSPVFASESVIHRSTAERSHDRAWS